MRQFVIIYRGWGKGKRHTELPDPLPLGAREAGAGVPGARPSSDRPSPSPPPPACRCRFRPTHFLPESDKVTEGLFTRGWNRSRTKSWRQTQLRKHPPLTRPGLKVEGTKHLCTLPHLSEGGTSLKQQSGQDSKTRRNPKRREMALGVGAAQGRRLRPSFVGNGFFQLESKTSAQMLKSTVPAGSDEKSAQSRHPATCPASTQ